MERPGKIVLYRSARPYWLVDATIDQLGLAIASGNNASEWTTRVLPDDLGQLKDALLARAEQGGASRAMRGTIYDLPDNEVLLLLLDNFGSTRANPYDEIKRFLAEAGIPADNDFCGSM